MVKECAQYEYEPFAWWLARERIGQDLRERYSVAQELPPRLLALVRKLDAVEDSQPNPSKSTVAVIVLSLTRFHRLNQILSASLCEAYPDRECHAARG